MNRTTPDKETQSARPDLCLHVRSTPDSSFTVDHKNSSIHNVDGKAFGTVMAVSRGHKLLREPASPRSRRSGYLGLFNWGFPYNDPEMICKYNNQSEPTCTHCSSAIINFLAQITAWHIQPISRFFAVHAAHQPTRNSVTGIYSILLRG